MANKQNGLTLIEILLVIILGTMLLLPTLNLLTSVRKNAYKGIDRLESLSTARIILEKVQRDIKQLCYWEKIKKTGTKDVLSESGFIVNGTSEMTEFRFPVFPGNIAVERQNPINMVTYIFDRKKKSLERKIAVNKSLKGFQKDSSEIIGKDIVGNFNISRREILSAGVFCYEIEVQCQSSSPILKNKAINLKTSVSSEFECRLMRNRNQILNLASLAEFSE